MRDKRLHITTRVVDAFLLQIGGSFFDGVEDSGAQRFKKLMLRKGYATGQWSDPIVSHKINASSIRSIIDGEEQK